MGTWGAAGGCSVLGVAVAKFSGPTYHPPLFVLPPTRTLVYVDRKANYSAVATDAQRIALLVSDALRKAKSTGVDKTDGSGGKVEAPVQVLDPGLAVEPRTRTDADGKRPTPAQVAATCDAAQFVYVELAVFDYFPAIAGQSSEGKIEARVWVVDTRSGAVLWPAEANLGYPVSAKLESSPLAYADNDSALKGKMDDELGTKIGRLFSGWSEE